MSATWDTCGPGFFPNMGLFDGIRPVSDRQAVVTGTAVCAARGAIEALYGLFVRGIDTSRLL